jgi:hypothetical protein
MFIYNYSISTMDYLVDETITNILGFVPDRIYSSMTCKRWTILLTNMYNQNRITNINDPYYLKTFHKTNGVISVGDIQQQIKSIDNPKCLHYLYNSFGTRNDTIMTVRICYSLLLRNCKLNNVCNPDDILNIMNKVVIYNENIQKIYHMIFKKKSYDILVLISTKNAMMEYYWLSYHLRTKNLNVLIEDIEIFVDKGITGLMYMRYVVNISTGHPLRTELLMYLEIQIAKKLNL